MVDINTLVMIATSGRYRSLHGSAPRRSPSRRRSGKMEMLTSGSITGAGSFRCQGCDYVLTLTVSETLGDCPRCGGEDFVRASLFRAGRIVAGDDSAHEDMLANRARPGFENE